MKIIHGKDLSSKIPQVFVRQYFDTYNTFFYKEHYEVMEEIIGDANKHDFEKHWILTCIKNVFNEGYVYLPESFIHIAEVKKFGKWIKSKDSDKLIVYTHHPSILSELRRK